MSENEMKKDKLNNKSNKPSNKKDEAKDLNEKLDTLILLYEELHNNLELCIQVNRIVIELLGGINPGRRTLDSVQLVKLRNEGVKVKDLAMMCNISECAMHRRLKELKEAGLLNV